MGLFGKKKLPMEAVMSYQPPSIDGAPMPIPQQAAMPQLDSMGRKPLTKTQKMLGILADGLAGFAGTTPQFAPMMQRERDEENQFRYAGQLREQQRAQGREDFLWKQENTRRDQNPHRWESNDGSLMEIDANGQARQVYKDPTPKMHFQPDGGGFGGGTWVTPGMPQQAQQPLLPIGGTLPPRGGPASQAPVNFPAARY